MKAGYSNNHQSANDSPITTVLSFMEVCSGVDSGRFQVDMPHSSTWRALMLSPLMPPAFSAQSGLPLPPGMPWTGGQQLESHQMRK